MRIGADLPFQNRSILPGQGKQKTVSMRDGDLNSSDLQELRNKRRMLSQTRGEGQQAGNGQKIFQGVSGQDTVTCMQSYTEALRTGREKAKKSSLAVKHVRYQAKSISSQIVRSKTSTSARQAVGKARREVIRLKRLRQNEAYDEEELQAAIVHAQSMERVAKKKLNHLQQEELIHVTDGEKEANSASEEEQSFAGDEWEREKLSDRDKFAEQEGLGEENDLSGEGYFSNEDLLSNMEGTMDEWLFRMESGMGDLTEEIMEELQTAFQDLLDQMGLSGVDELTGERREMTPEQFEELRRKHRLAEMKEIVKADGDYLKSMFQHFEKLRAAAATGGGAAGAGSYVGAGAVGISPSGNAPIVAGAIADGLSIGGGVDISL